MWGFARCASAQSFNVDLDIGFGDQQSGNGVPSSGFGGAAGSPGLWNRVSVNTQQTIALRGLDGTTTAATYHATGGVGVGGGYDNYTNTGDFALLLNDYATVGGEIDYHFTGLTPGQYLIYTYAVDASGLRVNATVTVPGADDPVQTVTGPMPGNRFIQGVTHSIHSLDLTGDSFVIQVSGPWPDTSVNGFQIVETPEPATALVIGAGLAVALVRRKRLPPHSDRL